MYPILQIPLIIFAVACAMVATIPFNGTSARTNLSFELYSIWEGPGVSHFCKRLRTNLVQLFKNNISQKETINDWIRTNSSIYNAINAYCDQSEDEQICLVKFIKRDGECKDLLEFVMGTAEL